MFDDLDGLNLDVLDERMTGIRIYGISGLSVLESGFMEVEG
jgi:hypothetical protein